MQLNFWKTNKNVSYKQLIKYIHGMNLDVLLKHLGDNLIFAKKKRCYPICQKHFHNYSAP